MKISQVHQRLVMTVFGATALSVSLGAAPFEPLFVTGYEPDETTGTPVDAHTWLVFDNTSALPTPTPWAMSVFYESPGFDVNDRYARIVDDPTGASNKVMQFWLKNAVIDSGFQSHTKGRIQTGFPGELADAVKIYSSQRMFIHEDMNSLHSYPVFGNQWWLGVIVQELWFGANWQGHPNPARINLTMFSYLGQMRLGLNCDMTLVAGGSWTDLWTVNNLDFALPVGEWVNVEIGYKMGNASTGRMIVVVTRESTGEREIVFDVTNWTYNPQADDPGGTGPVPLTHWNPQKLYTSDNVIHHVRDSGGVAQIFWDDFAFSNVWPPAFPLVSCAEDVNGDGAIDTADLGIMLSEFGAVGSAGDINGDGVVDTADLGILLAAFGAPCQ